MGQFIDMVGQRFNRLVVLHIAHKDKRGAYFWNCLCDCGETKIVRGVSLRDKDTQSCGCLNRERTSITLSKLKFKDLTGQKFGRFRVIDVADKTKLGAYRWNCICDCGKFRKVISYNLLNGQSQSCGCLMKEIVSALKFKDLTGQKFGKLMVVSVSHKNKTNNYLWHCTCDCGTNKIISNNSLIQGTQSCGCLNRQPPGIAAKNQLYSRYKSSANKRKFEWNLTYEDFSKLTQENCFYCNLSPKQIHASHDNKNGVDYIYNGIDRKDNSKGYLPNNCVPCCRLCNYAKRDISYDAWIEWLKRITKNFKTLQQV